MTFTAGQLVIANNGTSLATTYKRNGEPTDRNFAINLLSSDPSGLVSNPFGTGFCIQKGCCKGSSTYLFSTESGTIFGYNPKVDPNNAILAVDRSALNTVYKGLAVATSQGQIRLYATDFHNSKVDVFDCRFNYLFSFTDDQLPPNFAPFNISLINDKLYVTFALQKQPDRHDDQAGPGNGFVDIFDTAGNLIKRLVSQGALNSPWGLALAPQNFGKFSGQLLVGNFGDGKINIYNPKTGKHLGRLKDDDGHSIVIDGLWSIKFNNQNPTLFFTSGPNGESDGLVGKITP